MKMVAKPKPIVMAYQTFGERTWMQAPQECPACGADRGAEGNAGGAVRGGPVGSIARPDVVVYVCGMALARTPGNLSYCEARACKGVTVARILESVAEFVRDLEGYPASDHAEAVKALEWADRALRTLFTPKPGGDDPGGTEGE